MLRPQARPWAVPATSLAQGVAGMRAGREVAALRGARVQRHPGLDWVRPLHGSAASVETEVSPGKALNGEWGSWEVHPVTQGC